MDTPAGEPAAFGGVFAAFSPGHSRSKILQDKARYRFDRRASTKPRNAGLFKLRGLLSVSRICRISAIYMPPKRRCTNDFTAIYEERISIWKKTRRITPYGFTPKLSAEWTAHWSSQTVRAAVSLLKRLCTFTWATLSLMIQQSISAKLMYAGALLGGLHAEYLLPRYKRHAGRCGKKNWRVHVSTNWNRIKRTHSNAESTGQKLSGAFRSYPHLGHGLGQRHFRGFYVHVRSRCKQAINKVDSPACGQAASG